MNWMLIYFYLGFLPWQNIGVNEDIKALKERIVENDKLPKVLDLFRHFHLRALPVLDPSKGLPVAVLTR